MKGTLITEKNQGSLAQQYTVDPDDVDDLLPLDYYLVAEFGGEYFLGTLTEEDFNLAFERGQLLDNDYFIVTPK